MNTVKKTAGILLSAVLWIIILLSALFAFTTLATRDNTTVANLAGFSPLSVQTDSMSPTFHAGDMIIIHTVQPETLQEGDIITFHTLIENEYALNTHRIDSIEEKNGVRCYVTKGDNNQIEDSHIIQDSDIVGKYVTCLPHLGSVMSFLSSTVGFLVVIVLPLLVFFIYQVYHLIMVSISLKKAMALEAAQSSAEQLSGSDAAAMKAEAEAALEEARRLREEANKVLAAAQKEKDHAQ